MPRPHRPHRVVLVPLVALVALVILAPAASAQRTRADAGSRATLAGRADSLHAQAVALENTDTAGARAAIPLLRAEIALRRRLGHGKALGAAWNVLGHAYRDLGQLDSAEVTYWRAVRARRAAGDEVGVSASLNNLGNVQLDRARYDSALVYYRRSLAIEAIAGDSLLQAATLRNIAVTFRDSAVHDGAVRDSALAYYRRVLAIHAALGDRAGHAEEALVLEESGDAHHLAARADSAAHYWARARAAYRALGDARGEAALMRWVGNRQLDAALPDTVVRATLRTAIELSRALADTSGVADALMDLARLEFRVDAYAAAITTAREAVRLRQALHDGKGEAQALLLIARLQQYSARPDSALAAFRAALTVASREREGALVGDALAGMATAHDRLGRIDSATHDKQRALAAYRAAGDRWGEAQALAAVGKDQVWYNRHDSALVLLDSARRLQHGLGAAQDEIETLGLIASVYYEKMRPDSARASLHAALLAARSSGRPLLVASALEKLGRHHLAMVGQEAPARAYAAEALPLYRATGERRGAIRVLRMLGESHRGTDSAFAYLDEALRDAHAIGAPDVVADVLDAMGSAHRAAGRADSAVARFREAVAFSRRAGDSEAIVHQLQQVGLALKQATPPRYAEAAAYYDSAWVVQEAIRARATGDAARIGYNERMVNTARLLSDALSKDFRATRNQRSGWQSLAAEQRGRARALVDLMRGEGASIAPSLEAEAERLRQALTRPGLATVSYLLGSTHLTTTLTLPSGEVWEATEPLADSMLTRLVGEMREALNVDGAVLRAIDGALEPPPAETSRGLGIDAQASSAEALTSRMATLASLLLPDTLQRMLGRDVRELVIVPSHALTLVPFATLPFGQDGAPLGERFRLRYAPSLEALIAAEARPHPASAPGRKPAPPSALVIGNPAMPEVRTFAGTAERLKPLPGAEREGSAIAARLGVPLLQGEAASERVVRERMATAPVIHLATHGYAYASDARARDSFVALAPGAGADGLLTVGEVLDGPTLRADLVVLSACQTALGMQTAAEGTVGLQRAFLAKGARSLLVSLWSVDDAVTQQLMEHFYARWLAGDTKSEALRRAQADVRRTHPNPRYWAAFQLVGAN